jgi:hypothetical protein
MMNDSQQAWHEWEYAHITLATNLQYQASSFYVTGEVPLQSGTRLEDCLAAITASEMESEEAFERGIQTLLDVGCGHPASMKRFLVKFRRGGV